MDSKEASPAIKAVQEVAGATKVFHYEDGNVKLVSCASKYVNLGQIPKGENDNTPVDPCGALPANLRANHGNDLISLVVNGERGCKAFKMMSSTLAISPTLKDFFASNHCQPNDKTVVWILDEDKDALHMVLRWLRMQENFEFPTKLHHHSKSDLNFIAVKLYFAAKRLQLPSLEEQALYLLGDLGTELEADHIITMAPIIYERKHECDTRLRVWFLNICEPLMHQLMADERWRKLVREQDPSLAADLLDLLSVERFGGDRISYPPAIVQPQANYTISHEPSLTNLQFYESSDNDTEDSYKEAVAVKEDTEPESAEIPDFVDVPRTRKEKGKGQGPRKAKKKSSVPEAFANATEVISEDNDMPEDLPNLSIEPLPILLPIAYNPCTVNDSSQLIGGPDNSNEAANSSEGEDAEEAEGTRTPRDKGKGKATISSDEEMDETAAYLTEVGYGRWAGYIPHSGSEASIQYPGDLNTSEGRPSESTISINLAKIPKPGNNPYLTSDKASRVLGLNRVGAAESTLAESSAGPSSQERAGNSVRIGSRTIRKVTARFQRFKEKGPKNSP
ncbi:MAG: hypothetical protein M1814_005265 [Vezdaea aestivalis]|nr:MAG: hypothetical protein M1814_005265 [Vezdaea aestivalis]